MNKLAYCEKITTLRRVALISECGLVQWEGVQIDHDYVVLKKTYTDTTVSVIKTAELAAFAEENSVIALFQDDESTRFWEPRAQTYYDQFRYRYVDIASLFELFC